ncbi:MAG: TrbG/VirB9 family P-type conjugative transfer protein [Vicinamibacterales bacterium]
MLLVIGALLAAGPPLHANQDGVREVSVSSHTLVPLQTRVRYTTMIVLPERDEILDVICGDRDYWVISATRNIAHVKPAKAGAETNLNLVTASGAIYSFVLTEKAAPPDLKVYVASDEIRAPQTPRLFTAAHVEALEARLTEARSVVEATERRAVESAAAYRQHYPASLQFPYVAPTYGRPFFVRAIWHDGEKTYVKTDAKELPAIYEVVDGTPSLVNFQVDRGTYVVPKVLDRGYLAIGRQKFPFEQVER